MTEAVEVRPGDYHDSLRLLAATQAAKDADGVEAALVAMATELNLSLLADLGFRLDDSPTVDDLIVAVRAVDDEAVRRAHEAVAGALTSVARPSGSAELPPATVASPRADIALIAVRGEHAFVEAMAALDAGLHVMVFSDNVPVDQEIALKARAADLGLLVMGPDCGTVIVGGVGLGFANAVRPGPVSVVGASGTGIQQVCCLLDDAGIGVRHALGAGGRDLTDAVGGATTVRALALLDDDPATETVVVVSKPPEPAAAEHLAAAVAACRTPVVSAVGRTLTEAVADLAGPTWQPRRWGAVSDPVGGRLVGLFAGGTLRDEAAAITGIANLLDLGADEFTRGRAHPMIDQTVRLTHLARAVDDPEVGTVLLDVVLGHGAHPDPLAELAPELARLGHRGGRAVVSLCGARDDPQGLERQADAAVAAGAAVFLSNAEAARAGA
jgi:FdrA protein